MRNNLSFYFNMYINCIFITMILFYEKYIFQIYNTNIRKFPLADIGGMDLEMMAYTVTHLLLTWIYRQYYLLLSLATNETGNLPELSGKVFVG